MCPSLAAQYQQQERREDTRLLLQDMKQALSDMEADTECYVSLPSSPPPSPPPAPPSPLPVFPAPPPSHNVIPTPTTLPLRLESSVAIGPPSPLQWMLSTPVLASPVPPPPLPLYTSRQSLDEKSIMPVFPTISGTNMQSPLLALFPSPLLSGAGQLPSPTFSSEVPSTPIPHTGPSLYPITPHTHTPQRTLPISPLSTSLPTSAYGPIPSPTPSPTPFLNVAQPGPAAGHISPVMLPTPPPSPFNAPLFNGATVAEEEEDHEAEEADGDTIPQPSLQSHDRLGNRMMVLVHSSGIHRVGVHFCRCTGSKGADVQLLEMGLYPASTRTPQTAFTLSVLEDGLLENLESNTALQSFVQRIRIKTNTVEPQSTPVCGLMCSFTSALT